ncbi:TetR/AcrR family transcriptional regulator [Micromonospora sp. DT201]|uniref:TetR/AcrR family transcriptional regulator n=1 Tax=Micromonospora sp. DT201 TaxID=3393442 RepID=UPI003CF1DA87
MGVRKTRAAETRAALKDAAREQFAARGYLNTKITDITAAAGRATGSFYEHFESKEQLLDALAADMHDAAHEAMATDEPHPPHDLTDRDQLHQHLALAWRLIRGNREVTAALFEASVAGGNGDGQRWRRLAEDTRMLREHLEHSRETGRPLPGPPEVVAAVMGATLAMMGYALPESGRAGYTDDEVLDTIVALFAGGLGGSA